MKLNINEEIGVKDDIVADDEYYKNQINIIMDNLFTLMREADNDGRYKLKNIVSRAYDTLESYLSDY